MPSAISALFFGSVKGKQKLIFFFNRENLSYINLVFYFFRPWHQGSNQLWLWRCAYLIALQMQASLEETELQTHESSLFLNVAKA